MEEKENITIKPVEVKPAENAKASFGWSVLGFFFPLVGLILFIVFKSEKPSLAKMAGLGALVSVIIEAALITFYFVLCAAMILPHFALIV